MCGRYNTSDYDEIGKRLKVRPVEHIRISSLIFKNIKPSNKSTIRGHLLICNNLLTSITYFTILTNVLNKNVSTTRLPF